jgi:ATP-dependent Clp protease ATP-binding subunit ClpC
MYSGIYGFFILNMYWFLVMCKILCKTFFGEKGYDQQFGARPLHRAIQKYLEDPLAEEILSAHVKEGDTLIADLDEETSLIKFTLKTTSKKEKSPGSKADK